MDDRWILLDGAMGTMLQEAGMPPGAHPEVFGYGHPETVKEIHKKYLYAGSRILYTNTFGANPGKLENTGLSTETAVLAAIEAAREAIKEFRQETETAESVPIRVALDVGPIGELLEPLGILRFEEAYEMYRQVVAAGEKGGADLIVIETFTDLYDAKAALLAAKENTALPVWVTMSYEENGRTFTGTRVESMALVLTGLGADAIGFNCSLGPEEILPLARRLGEWTHLPLIIKPNAGLPDPSTGRYDLPPEDFGRQMKAFLSLPVMALGGCCGTNPSYIRALGESLREGTESGPAGKVLSLRTGVCSASCVKEFGGVRVIGERLNPTGKKRFSQALLEQDLEYISRVALEEEEAGADILDVNVGVPGADEVILMRETVKALQGIVSAPLQIDSSNPRALEAGLRAYHGRAIINSVNADGEKLDTILPLAKKYGAAVIGLCMDESGIPKTAEDRLKKAAYILEKALSYGLKKEDLIIDCLALTVSAQQDQALETLKAMTLVREQLGLSCTLGVSNISFGLPERNLINESFLTQAMYCGLDFPIINPNHGGMMDAVRAFRVISGEDKDSSDFIARYSGSSSRPVSEHSPAASGDMDIETAILKGLKEETKAIALSLLESMSEMDLINRRLIPALDAVGLQYEKQILFLPQLINAANAACGAFDLIKERIAKKGGESLNKGSIVLATVRGDIHDIGKNIVKVILENYGYRIVDLGRDVPAERVVEAVTEQKVGLVGLSALMTTTLPSMAETIRAVKEAAPECKIWVGGAVLTKDFAMEMGADYYARDARASVDIAREVLGRAEKEMEAK